MFVYIGLGDGRVRNRAKVKLQWGHRELGFYGQGQKYIAQRKRKRERRERQKERTRREHRGQITQASGATLQRRR